MGISPGRAMGLDEMARMAVLRGEVLRARKTPWGGVYAEYNTMAGQSFNDSSEAIVDYGTKVWDTHGIVTTGASWHATAPMTRPYFVAAAALMAASTAWAVGEALRLAVRVNGAEAAGIGRLDAMAAGATNILPLVQGARLFWLRTGDTLDVRLTQYSGGALAMFSTSAVWNWVTILGM